MGEVFFEKCMVELRRNSYEPDFLFYTSTVAEQITPDTLIFPVPQLIAEILSPSTAKNDMGIKKRDYERHGVNEYWIIDPEAEWIECYVLNVRFGYILLDNTKFISQLPNFVSEKH